MEYLCTARSIPANVHHGVLKEHKVHSGDEVVVTGHSFHEQVVQLLPARHGHVLRLADAAGEVAEYVRPLEHYALVNVLDELKNIDGVNYGEVIYGSRALPVSEP